MDEKVDVKRINATIDEMEKQVDKLKAVADIYSQLEDLNSKITVNKETMDDIIKELEIATNGISENLLNSSNVLASIKNDFSVVKQELEQNVNLLRKESVQVISNTLSNIENKIASNVEVIRKENKENYRYLEEFTTSKLDRSKSDLVIEIRDAGSSTEKNIESKLNQGLINLEKSLIERFTSLENKLIQSFKDNRILFYVILGASIISMILNIVMLTGR